MRRRRDESQRPFTVLSRQQVKIAFVSGCRFVASIVSAGVIIGAHSESWAEKRLPDLAQGLTMEAVRKSWGPPAEVEERETRRVLVWNYPSGAQVVFQAGVVSQWKVGKHDAMRSEIALPPAPQIELDKANDSRSQEAYATRDLVREIAAEVPSGPDSPSGPSNEIVLGEPSPVLSNFGQQQQQIVQPAIPQPVAPLQGVNPGGASDGGFFISDEEEG